MDPRFFKVIHPIPGCDCRAGDVLCVEGTVVQRMRTLTLPAAKVLRYAGEGHLTEVIHPGDAAAPPPSPPREAPAAGERRRRPRRQVDYLKIG